MKLIGLTAKAGAGKDTAASGLTNFHQMAFAKPLKDSIKILYDLTDEQLHGNLKEVIDPRWKMSPRQIMQELGDYCRKNDVDFFVTHMKSRIEKAEKEDHSIVITDVRYDSEAKLIKELGGEIIKIERRLSDPKGQKKLFTSTTHTDHSSEQGISQKYITYTVENNGTIEDLTEKISKITTKS